MRCLSQGERHHIAWSSADATVRFCSLVLMRRLPGSSTRRVLGFAVADALLLGVSWVLVYALRFGQWPNLSRGPLGLILAWLLIQYLLGTYTALARHQLNLGRQWRNCLVAAASVFALAVLITGLRGEPWLSTMSRSFLIPVLGLGFFSTQILRVSQANAHLWQPQEQWLMLVSARERQELSQAIEAGGCVLPCGLEWRAVQGMPAIPTHLPDLLELDGVVIGSEHQLMEEDRRTLLGWQDQGVRLLSVPGWSELFLKRLPPALVPPGWAERVEAFSHARSGPSARLKRLGDLVVSGLLLVLLLPLASLRKPALFTDRCSGRGGHPFQRLRLRASGRLGALPQLINVWRGEMSLVGPRPLTLAVMQELQARFPGAELRQWMRPGMTGWGRIAGPPPEEPDAVAWELGRDLYYLRNHSLLLDLRLLATSVLTLFAPAPWP